MDKYSQLMELYALLTPEQRTRLMFLAFLMAQSNGTAQDSTLGVDNPDNST